MLTENKARKPSTHLETTHNPKRGKRIKYRGQEGRRRGGAGWGGAVVCGPGSQRPSGLLVARGGLRRRAQETRPGFSLGRAPELRLFAKGCLNDIYNLQESL